MQRKLSGNYNTQPSLRKLSGLESTKSNKNAIVLSRNELDHSALINCTQPLSVRNSNLPCTKLPQKTVVQNEIYEKGFLESSSQQRVSIYSRGQLACLANTQQTGCEIVYKGQKQSLVTSVVKSKISFSGLKNRHFNQKVSKVTAPLTERSKAPNYQLRSKESSKQVNNQNMPAQTAKLAFNIPLINDSQTDVYQPSVQNRVADNSLRFERLLTRPSIYSSYVPDIACHQASNIESDDSPPPPIDYDKLFVLRIIERLTEKQTPQNDCPSESEPETRIPKSTSYAGSINFITKIVDQVKLKERVLFLSIELFNVAQKNDTLSTYEPSVVLLTTIWIAAKFEDAWAPFANQFFKLDSVKNSKQKMIVIEGIILSDLSFNLNITLAFDFFEIFAFFGQLSPKAVAFGTFAINLLLSDSSFHSRNRKTFAFALCCFVSKLMRAPRFWAERTVNGQQVIGFWINGGLQRSNHQNTIKDDFSRNREFDVCFDALEVQEEEKQISATLKKVLSHAGVAIIARYSSDHFFRISKSKLIETINEF